MAEDAVELRVRDELAGTKQFETSAAVTPNLRAGLSNERTVGAVFIIVLAATVICVLATSLGQRGHRHGPQTYTGSEHLQQFTSDHPVWKGPSIEMWDEVHWRGFTTMKGGKGYAQTPMGQVHYRDVGPRNCRYPIVLLHQSPLSMIEWAGVQNELAVLGIRTITVDTPGFGLSDLPTVQPTIAEFADNLIPVLDHLQLDRVVIAGHFTGAQIALSFAGNHRNRVAGVVLHGIHAFTDEATAKALLRMESATGVPMVDGSHLCQSFEFFNGTATQAHIDALTHSIISTFMSGPDIGHYAAFQYSRLEMETDLMAVQVPGFFIVDDDGILPEDIGIARKLRPDFRFLEFADSMLSLQVEPARWARAAAGFVSSLPA